MTDRLAGKVVLVTGATRGIGRAVAELCADEGAATVVVGRNSDTGQSVVDGIAARGGQATFVQCDVTSESNVAAAVARATDTYGALHGLVANASGYASWTQQGESRLVTELTLEAWEETLRTDLTGTFLPLKYGLRAMCEGDGGSVVTISTHSAMEGVNGNDAYAAAKGGVISMTRSVASYYSRYAIRCNCLALGFVDSGASVAGLRATQPIFEGLYRHSLGRVGIPRDIAYACTYLLADESEYLTGAVIPLDGGSYGASHMPFGEDLPRYRRKRQLTPGPQPT